MRKKTLLITLIFLIFSCVNAYATMAMCFNCGELHPGPLNACDKCGFKPDMANFGLWTTFSDQFLSQRTLENFGSVMKQIAEVTPDFEERLWIFFKYMGDNYPDAGLIDGTSLQIPDKYKESVPAHLKRLQLPKFELEKTFR